jgi:hypothetical protein
VILDLFVVSARTNERHHHHQGCVQGATRSNCHSLTLSLGTPGNALADSMPAAELQARCCTFRSSNSRKVQLYMSKQMGAKGMLTNEQYELARTL